MAARITGRSNPMYSTNSISSFVAFGWVEVGPDLHSVQTSLSGEMSSRTAPHSKHIFSLESSLLLVKV